MKARRFSSLRDLLRSWQTRLSTATWDARVGGGLGAFAVLLAFAVGFCGIAGPFPEGHFAASASIGTAAVNMWRWKTLFPVLAYLDRPPGPANFYMHHPLGVFWTVALLGKVVGFSDWVIRFPALVYVTGATWVVFLIARMLWGTLAAGLAALAFVSLPMTLGFANFHALEQPVIFGILLSTWGYLRFFQTRLQRYAWISVAAFVFATNHDWPAYIWGGFFVAGLFVYAYVIPERLRAPIDSRAVGRFWALMCIGAVFSLALSAWLVTGSGRFSDLLTSYANRSSGSGTPLSVVLTARHYRIALMFTGLAIGLGKLALPVTVVRAVIRRDHRELLILPIFLCALLQYVIFKQGADVHIFWPHYFTAYFGLAMGALAATVIDATVWLGSRLRQGQARAAFARWAPWVALSLVGLPLVFVLRDGLSIVRLARETGGRFAEANLDSDLDKTAVLTWFAARTPVSAGVAYHPGIYAPWSIQWALRPRLSTNGQSVTGPVTDKTRIYILDTRKAPVADLRLAASRFHVHAVGHIWMIDRLAPPAPLDGYVLDEQEPSWWQWWLYGPSEPMRDVRASPWVTWEWRTLLGQTAAAPGGTPAATDELRIAHNFALETGNTGAAAQLKAALEARLNLPVRARYGNGTTLIGALHRAGARRGLTLFFLAGSFDGDSKFSVRAKVAKPPRLSTLPADPADLEIAGPPIWPTSLWRRGHIYSFEAVYRKRPGTEVLSGSWVPSPARVGGPPSLELIRL